MPVSLAVRASSSVPFLFTPVTYGGHIYVDGGLLRLMPHDSYDAVTDGPVLALRIRPPTVDELGLKADNITNLVSFALTLMDAILLSKDSHNSLHVSALADDIDMVVVSTGMIDPLEIDLSQHSKVTLVRQGYTDTREHLRACGFMPPAAPGVEHLPAAPLAPADDFPPWLNQLLTDFQASAAPEAPVETDDENATWRKSAETGWSRVSNMIVSMFKFMTVAF
jgi:hypothetical protein